jgi:ribosomal-protein-alanine N-acetyltransferase
MTLETERLYLTTWDPADWTAFRPIATDPEVMRYITGGEPWSDDAIQFFVNRQIETYKTRRFCRWKLLDKSDGALIGFCGPGFWREYPDPEIGWWIERERWGRGLATEAARAALSDALDRVQLERIVSIAMPANTASINIMRKLGLTYECDFEHSGVQLVRYQIHRSH